MNETQTFYKGYLRINNTKEYIKKINDEYKFFVYSDDHIYNVIEKTECYDKEGNKLGFYDNKNIRITKSEEKQLEKQMSVIQYNYDFYLLPLGCVSTIDEVNSAYELINSVFSIKDIEDYRYYRESFNRDNAVSRFFYDEKEAKYKEPFIPRNYRENFIPFEIVKLGFSREITNITNKKLFDLDIKEYTKRKDNFIKKNPEYKDSIEFIYKINIGHLSLFWDVPVKSLLRDNFNRNIQSIKKLNKKITNKIKTK
tara:strand:- start:298 stop:1059 length:762 start_codon:yes stop_codon:yes gene_type:complete